MVKNRKYKWVFKSVNGICIKHEKLRNTENGKNNENYIPDIVHGMNNYLNKLLMPANINDVMDKNYVDDDKWVRILRRFFTKANGNGKRPKAKANQNKVIRQN
jgi:hypothetical protein